MKENRYFIQLPNNLTSPFWEDSSVPGFGFQLLAEIGGGSAVPEVDDKIVLFL